jgi:hypothetical protein
MLQLFATSKELILLLLNPHPTNLRDVFDLYEPNTCIFCELIMSSGPFVHNVHKNIDSDYRYGRKNFKWVDSKSNTNYRHLNGLHTMQSNSNDS